MLTVHQSQCEFFVWTEPQVRFDRLQCCASRFVGSLFNPGMRVGAPVESLRVLNGGNLSFDCIDPILNFFPIHCGILSEMPPTTRLVTVSGYELTDRIEGSIAKLNLVLNLQAAKRCRDKKKGRWWIAQEEGGLKGYPDTRTWESKKRPALRNRNEPPTSGGIP